MARIRKDVASLGSGWSPELEWYAKAVRELQSRPPSDRTSWRYLGAIHGFNSQLWLDRGIISSTDPLPPASETNGRMWGQCQHQSWFFLPWHRGYLAAFEEIVARTVRDLEGPDDWALPYWNYLNAEDPDARNLPEPFLAANLPDGSANPLSASPRSGITALGPVDWFPYDITLEAMTVARFTSAPRALGFGGGVTGFNNSGGEQSGALEFDPHNAVHVIIGGPRGSPGFMRNPLLAGLDPIFWLHHCNIDRLWEAWLQDPANTQENGYAWSIGPFPRRFEMPDPEGDLNVFTPDQTLPGGDLAPQYDDLTKGTQPGAVPASLDAEEGEPMPARLSSEPPPDTVLVGANAEQLTVGGASVATMVRLAPEEADIASDPVEQRVFLNLENVRGNASSGVLSIRVGTGGAGAPSEHIKTVALFGLAQASEENNSHGGNGITVTVDITGVAKRLAQEAGEALDRLKVYVEQPGEGEDDPITVGRVSIYKQPVD